MTAELFLAGALFIIMIGMGLDLVWNDFRRVLLYPKAVAVGLSLKVLVLPFIMFGILLVWPNQPIELAVGFILLAACPGGATSNIITGLCRGDVALSVTLTAVASFITVLTIPLFTELALKNLGVNATVAQLPVGKTILMIIAITIFPVSLGMLVKRYQPAIAAKADKPVRIVSAVLLIVIIIGIVIQNQEHLGALIAKAGPLCLLMNVIALGIGYGIPLLFKINEKQAVTIAVETGIINTTLAMAVASTLGDGGLGENGYAFPAAVYSLIMYATVGGIVWWGHRRFKDNPKAS